MIKLLYDAKGKQTKGFLGLNYQHFQFSESLTHGWSFGHSTLIIFPFCNKNATLTPLIQFRQKHWQKTTVANKASSLIVKISRFVKQHIKFLE